MPEHEIFQEQTFAGEEEELEKLVKRLHKASTAYGMEISAKQHQRHQQGDQSKRTEACDCHKLQVPGLSCIRRGFQASRGQRRRQQH